MVKAIVSEATRKDAHNLDDSIDRWKLQKEVEANVEYLRLPEEILEGLSLSSLKTVSDVQVFKDLLQERRKETESTLSHYNMLLRQYGDKPFFKKLYTPRRKAYVEVMGAIEKLQQSVDVLIAGTRLAKEDNTLVQRMYERNPDLKRMDELMRLADEQTKAEIAAERAERVARRKAAVGY